jgi:hypothetical protein
MPYLILRNGTEQKSLEARSGLTLKPSHFSPIHKIRYGVPSYGGGCNTAKAIMQGSRNRVKNISESLYTSQDVFLY